MAAFVARLVLAISIAAPLASAQLYNSSVTLTEPRTGPYNATNKGDYFGYSLAVCGPGASTTVIGAPFWGSGFQGAPLQQKGAPVLVYNAATAAKQYIFPESDAGASAGYGIDVACSSSGGVIVVGAWGDAFAVTPDTPTQVGAAYVYLRNATGGYTLARPNLANVSTAVGGAFGSAVAVDSTGSFVLVCGGLVPVSATQVGACWIFGGPGFSRVTLVVAPASLAYSGLGISASTAKIALIGQQLLVIMGAPGASSGGAGSALVAVYTAANMSLAFPPFLVVGSATAVDDYLGGADINISLDNTRVFFGASGNSNVAGSTSTSAANAYVDAYTITSPLTSSASFVFKQRIKMASAPAGFGIGLGLSLDNKRLVVGAGLAGAPVPGGSPAVPATPGAAYTFALNATTGLYAYESTVTNPAPAPGDMAGYYVGIGSDKSQVIITAPGASPFGALFPASGAAYNLALATPTPAPRASGAAAAARPAAAAAVAAAAVALLLARVM